MHHHARTDQAEQVRAAAPDLPVAHRPGRPAPAAARPAAPGPVRGAGPLRWHRTHHPGRAEPVPGSPGRRPRRRDRHHAHPGPGPRPCLQPAHRLLVPPRRRLPALCRGRGAQHVRGTARLSAPPGRQRPRHDREGVLRLAVLPRRRRVPDAAARTRRPARPERPSGARGRPPVHRDRTGHPPPRHPRALARLALRHPFSTVAVSLAIRLHGIRLYLRGLPVQPRPQHRPQEGMQ